MQHKAMLGVFKASDSGKGIVIEGWANKAIVDRGGDIIPKSAWNLDNFKKNSIILFNHDKNQPIGKAVAIEPRDEGLYVKAKISGSADPGISKVRDLIKEGVLNAFSVGFDSSEEQKSADGHNEIRAAELFEISVVSIPMNQDSLFSLAKSYDIAEIKTKAVELYEADYGSAPETSEKDAAAPESPETEDKTSGDDLPAEDTKAAPASESDSTDEPEAGEGDGQDAQEPSTPAKKEMELMVQAIKVPKSAFASIEAAAQYVSQGGFSTEYATEEGDFYLFPQAPAEQFSATAELPLDADLGIVAVIGSAISEMPEAEVEDPQAETEQDSAKSKELPTQPLPEPVPVGDNVLLQTAQQTNVLLGQLIAETQNVRAAVADLSKIIEMMPKPAPVQAPEPPKAQEISQSPEQDQQGEAVAKCLDIVRESLEATRNKLQALERRDAHNFNLGEYQ